MSTRKWHGGKGDTPRGLGGNTYADNWEAIFGKKPEDVKSRKVIPDHGKTSVHDNKTRPSRQSYKNEMLKQSDLNWDGNDNGTD
jgi:hypothetical protein